MKKNVIIGMALALGMLSVGVITASAAETVASVQTIRQSSSSGRKRTHWHQH